METEHKEQESQLTKTLLAKLYRTSEEFRVKELVNISPPKSVKQTQYVNLGE